MVFLKSLFGESAKTTLTRELLKHRMKGERSPSVAHAEEDETRELVLGEVQAAPEAAIVEIVERYASLRKRDVTPEDAIARIDKDRIAVAEGASPLPATLEQYVQYRIDVERYDGTLISVEQVAFCVRAAKELFRCA